MEEEIKIPKQKMSIEQAGNFLAEKKETMAEDIKAETKKHAISYASPEDRRNFIMYGLSLMEDISESAKNSWCVLTGKAPGLCTTKEVAMMLVKFMTLRINGYGLPRIAQTLGVEASKLNEVEALAIRCCMAAIEKRKNTGLPIVGMN